MADGGAKGRQEVKTALKAAIDLDLVGAKPLQEPPPTRTSHFFGRKTHRRNGSCSQEEEEEEAAVKYPSWK